MISPAPIRRADDLDARAVPVPTQEEQSLMPDTKPAPLRVDMAANMRKQLGLPAATADAGSLRVDIVANMQRILDNRSREGARA